MAKTWMEDLSKDEKTVKLRKADASVKHFSTVPALIVACLTMKNMKKYPDNKRQMFESDLAMQSRDSNTKHVTLCQ